MDDMKVEYEILTMLSEKRWQLRRELAEVEAAIARNSQNFFVGEDGLVEVGAGVC